MKKRLLISAILCLGVVEAFAQKPRNGKYTYAIAYWEWGSKPRNLTCEVVIKGDSVKVYSNDPAYKGQLIDEGVLLLHKKSGKWIIGHTPEARNAPRVGGCEEGPTVIEFKKKRVWLC